MANKDLVVNQLNDFIEHSENRIDALLSKFGWTKDNLLQTESIAPNEQVADVNERPKLEETFPPSFHSINAPFSIRMGVPLEAICSRDPPTSLEELHVNFTPEERLLLYEHAVKNTVHPPNVPDIKIRFKPDSHSEEKHASWPEIAAMERDSRRRNPKHRVARNPLTYNEELRHLIHIQTEALTQHLQQEATAQQKVEGGPSHKKAKRRRRSRSISGATERRHGKKKRKRSRSRSKDSSRKRLTTPERKERKSQKKHKKKHDR
ncbi:membrane-associated guanylate kinase, WW and PDZ domain-containing protein 1-like isoform X2 [Anopheles coustani]|uniref:membrane-associated guanylate kinase, WW and PDZ domain-containing protein 1-like isoform X2 n=1 Tax=Anopheles coustani TaxID=139045 RepID=UPI002659815D|nr:membrane-associated guanylate kinase, WW and PDZ domain-containing protein 1-like isoform X2 [Anopheles coustani]